MAKKTYSKPRKSKYTASERRAYWVGVGYHAGQSLDMDSKSVQSLMTDKEKISFVNGRTIADDLSSKFVPDLVAGQTKRNRSKKKTVPMQQLSSRGDIDGISMSVYGTHYRELGAKQKTVVDKLYEKK